jgi:hypothetical protein
MVYICINLKKIKLDANNYDQTFAVVAGCFWLMGQYNVNWSVWLYTENSAFQVMQCWITRRLFCVAFCSEQWKEWTMRKITYFRPSSFELRKIGEY